jgi:hypothetical protein
MDIYRKFTPYSSAVVGSGITFPPDMRTLVISNNVGIVNIDLFTYGPTGGTQSNRIRLNTGTYFLPFQLWGISSGSAGALNYLIGY